MKYLLDTNICIYYLNRTSGPLMARLDSTAREDIVISAITKAELLYGAHKSARSERNRELIRAFAAPFRTLAFDDECVESYAEIRAALERRGTPVGRMDLLIAAQGRAFDLVVVTNNEGEYRRVPGLEVENWLDS